MRLKNRIKAKIRRFAFTSGVATDGHANSFFQLEDDCQISNLAFLYKLFFGTDVLGTYVEIGANDGLQVSNTFCLAKRGWRGELVEPISQIAKRASLNFKHYPSISVHNLGVAAPGEKQIEIRVAGLLSTGRPELYEEYKATDWALKSLTDNIVTAEAVTLDDFLSSRNLNPAFELLVVDVEGYEKQVFAGFSINYWRPKMIIVELSDTHPDLRVLSVEHAKIYLKILESGYIVVYKDAINSVFVSKPHFSEIFSEKS
jgi:FkbM family methyltransferase